MKNFKTQKGITLVALIITIVVLLILATVAITSMSEYDIIGKANAAAEKYENKAGIEDNTLKDYSSIIDKYMGNSNSGTGSGDEDEGEDTTNPYFIIRNETTGESNTYYFVAGQTWKQYIGQEGYDAAVEAGKDFYYVDNTLYYIINQAGINIFYIENEEQIEVDALDEILFEKIYYVKISHGGSGN